MQHRHLRSAPVREHGDSQLGLLQLLLFLLLFLVLFPFVVIPVITTRLNQHVFIQRPK